MGSVYLQSHTVASTYDQNNFVGYKIKLYPTEEQKVIFRKYIGATRFIYNKCIDLQEDYVKNYDPEKDSYKYLTYVGFSKYIINLRNEFPWLREYDLESLRYVARDLVFAYKLYFSQDEYRKPKYKSKKNYRQGFPIRSDRLSILIDKVKIPSIGYVNIKHIQDYNLIGSMVRKSLPYRQYIGARIIYDGCDYYLTFRLQKSEQILPSSYYQYNNIFYQQKPSSDVIGIDIGCSINNWIVRSDGGRTKLPNVSKEEKKVKILQTKYMHKYNINHRSGERTNRMTKNEEKLLRQINKNTKRITSKIKNSIYETAHDIVRNKPEAIVLEDIDVRDMLMSRSKCKWPILAINAFNHNIMLHQPRTVRSIISSIANTANIPVIIADRQYKSSQICSCCGAVNNIGSKKVYRCKNCGAVIDRDLNAAINLANYAHSEIINTCA